MLYLALFTPKIRCKCEILIINCVATNLEVKHVFSSSFKTKKKKKR